MKKTWRTLSSAELKEYEQINQNNFGSYSPTLLQNILILIAQNSFTAWLPKKVNCTSHIFNKEKPIYILEMCLQASL